MTVSMASPAVGTTCINFDRHVSPELWPTCMIIWLISLQSQPRQNVANGANWCMTIIIMHRIRNAPGAPNTFAIGILPSVIASHYMQNMVCRRTGWPRRPSMISKRSARQTVASGWISKRMIRITPTNERLVWRAIKLWKRSRSSVMTEIECYETAKFRDIFLA